MEFKTHEAVLQFSELSFPGGMGAGMNEFLQNPEAKKFGVPLTSGGGYHNLEVVAVAT